MKIWITIVILGVIISIFGIIFHLQGQSVLGPESSFMYANPDWITYGIQIATLGIIISGVGISINNSVLKTFKRKFDDLAVFKSNSGK